MVLTQSYLLCICIYMCFQIHKNTFSPSWWFFSCQAAFWHGRVLDSRLWVHKHVLLTIITQYTQASDKHIGKLLPGVCFGHWRQDGRDLCAEGVVSTHTLSGTKTPDWPEKKNVGIHALQSESLTSPLSYLTRYDVVCSWCAAIDFSSSKKKRSRHKLALTPCPVIAFAGYCWA